MSLGQTFQSRIQRENMYLRTVETTRPLRGVVLFDQNCDLNDAEAQEDTVQACRSANPGIIIICTSRNTSKPSGVLHDTVHSAT